MRFLKDQLVHINFSLLKKEFWFWSGFGLCAFGIGKLLDPIVFPFVNETLRTYSRDLLSVFLTEHLFFFLLVLFALVTGYRIWSNPDHHSKLVPALFSAFVAGILAFVGKSFFAIERPFWIYDYPPLVHAPSLSFPSSHAAIAFALLIPFWRISKWIGVSWFFFALMIAFARVYQNVHYPSDIAGGIFLGCIIGAFFSHEEVKKIINVLWKQLEFRRQSFHFLAGFFCVFAHWAGFLRLRFVALILVVGLILSFLSQKRKFPVLSHLLQMFDRPRDAFFPGKGAFYFLLGVFLVFILFQGPNIRIAYASILILSVGDSLNHLFGTKMPKNFYLPWNKRKHLPGLLFGIFAGTFASQFFVPFFPALIATSFALLFESVPLKFGKFYIDDNILVPLIAGGILWMLA